MWAKPWPPLTGCSPRLFGRASSGQLAWRSCGGRHLASRIGLEGWTRIARPCDVEFLPVDGGWQKIGLFEGDFVLSEVHNVVILAGKWKLSDGQRWNLGVGDTDFTPIDLFTCRILTILRTHLPLVSTGNHAKMGSSSIFDVLSDTCA
jgi:hypothetical protein